MFRLIRSGAEGNRTPDLLDAIEALSQLSYDPEGAPHVARTFRSVNAHTVTGAAARGGAPRSDARRESRGKLRVSSRVRSKPWNVARSC